MQRKTDIIIIDDHPIFRQGLITVIGNDPKLRVVGEADDGAAGLDLVRTVAPQIVVLDVDMPIMDGIAVARELKASELNARIIFLTMHKDPSILRSMSSLGVRGYVLKDSALNEIVDCIHKVTSGRTYISPDLNDLLLDGLAQGVESPLSSNLELLTSTEKNILRLISNSKTNREIASELFVSIRTIETHRYNICTKLSLNGSHALLKFALQNKERILSVVKNK